MEKRNFWDDKNFDLTQICHDFTDEARQAAALRDRFIKLDWMVKCLNSELYRDTLLRRADDFEDAGVTREEVVGHIVQEYEYLASMIVNAAQYGRQYLNEDSTGEKSTNEQFDRVLKDLQMEQQELR